MRRTLVLLFAVAAVAAAQASSVQTQLKPGKWEVDVRMEIPNLPGGAMPPTKSLVCVTAETSKKPYMISTQQQTGGDCQYGEPKVDGSKLTTAMTCQGGTVKGTFDIEVRNGGQAYSGVSTMTVGGQAMKTIYDGKWVGATCDQK